MSALSAQIITTAEGIKRREAIPRTVAVTSPSAGAEFSILVPGGVIWRVQSIVSVFTASAVVANRFTNLIVTGSDGQYVRIPPAAVFTASQVGHPIWLKGAGTSYQPNIAAGMLMPFPDSPIIAGSTIASLTTGLDAGDQWSSVVIFLVEIWERSVSVEEQYELARVLAASGNANLDLEDNY